jgi:hypothetical protein
MLHEFFFPTLSVLFVLGCWGLVILGRHLREKNRLRAQEILLEKRIHAMKNGLSSDESPTLGLPLEPPPERSPAEVVIWIRVAALCVGFFLLFAGLGMLVAFHLAYDFKGIEAIGWIPTLAGVGLLLFSRLSRDLASQLPGA